MESLYVLICMLSAVTGFLLLAVFIIRRDKAERAAGGGRPIDGYMVV
jgi:hypothetical protein